ncbi:NUDIX domain-containing protein [Peterkaempfera bronchialis]|uniref:NUDIX domain-containing protein n=1 Tax=Peterkaempfera bronchialis TaxID=2126346 RepID=A0A345T4I5_9ACTN|nr:NUDIX domain-containing protein [Peterkaempfera bronchialis]AXI80890.1 NUDIX domain-containing protein [Peterkaempfera bronchialis]
MTAPPTDDSSPAVDPELAHYLAQHAAPAACADALIRDGQGRILLVDPTYKEGWDLPGGMLEDEEPVRALAREVDEELGLAIEVGRLLAVDTLPAAVYGRTVLAFLYAGHAHGEPAASALTLQDSEIRAAGFFPEEEALALLPEPVSRRLSAALAAERGSYTAVLRDGHRLPVRRRDHYALLPAPMVAATVLLTDTAGRVLVLDPRDKRHLELPGGMVEAQESPGQAAARELAEELGLAVPVGRLLAVDTSPASATRHGRAQLCLVFAAPPLTAAQAEDLVFVDGEVRAAYWMDRKEAAVRLPARLAARVAAGLAALASGGIVHLEQGVPVAAPVAPSLRARAAEARAAMVERLEDEGVLTDPAVRRALLAVPREVLLPRCYVRRPTAPGRPKAWQLLDGADPRDQAEWLVRIHDGGAVPVRQGGEPLDAAERGQVVTGGGFTVRSAAVAATVEVLQALSPAAGDRVLELGTGPGVVTAALCELVGGGAVTTVEADPQVAEAARARLAALGYRPRIVHGDGAGGCPGARFDRIVLSFAVRCLPPALLEQLADGGLLLAPLTTGAPGRPARATVVRSRGGLSAVLRPVGSGHRPLRGPDRATAPPQLPTGPVAVRRSTVSPPARTEGGFWLAAEHLVPGLVLADGAVGGEVAVHAPGERSSAVVRPDGGCWTVEYTGPRDLWAEVEDVHGRWVRAGRPDHYRIDLSDPAAQRVTGGSGRRPLEWHLPSAPTASAAAEPHEEIRR